MPTASEDSPATLFAPLALVLGIVAAVATAVSAFVGIAIPLLVGSLAVTFAVLGLVYRTRRTSCLVGLVGGATGVLYPVFVLTTLAV